MPLGILVIEDEVPLRRVLRGVLRGDGYGVWEAGSKSEGLSLFAQHHPHAILLDLGLPDGDGLELVAHVRRSSQVPIVVVSARESENDQVNALDSGANDYITKPFREGELLARVRAALRSAALRAAPRDDRLQVGPLRLHPTARRVYLNDKEISLTPTEFSLLQIMARHPGRVVTHRQLLSDVWGQDSVRDAQYLRVFMHQLRQKLEENPTRPALLITKPGVGYALKAPGD